MRYPASLILEELSCHRGSSYIGPLASSLLSPSFLKVSGWGPDLLIHAVPWAAKQEYLGEGHTGHGRFHGKSWLGHSVSGFDTVQPRCLLLAWWPLLVETFLTSPLWLHLGLSPLIPEALEESSPQALCERFGLLRKFLFIWPYPLFS